MRRDRRIQRLHLTHGRTQRRCALGSQGMCLMVYLGASKPLRLIPWDGAKPSFHVTDMLPEFRSRVAPQLGTSHVYYVGSHEGCGCGFQGGQYPDQESEWAKSERESMRAFRDYLQAELAHAAKIG